LDDDFILLADDRPDLADLFVKALRMGGIDNRVVVVGNGVECLDFLFGTGNYADQDTNVMPRLIILDHSMPRMNGVQTLERIRADERTKYLPVVIFSSTAFPEDVSEAYRLGVNSFVNKISDSLPYPELISCMVRYWLLVSEPPPVGRYAYH
jgi:two-component system, response regulator